MTHQHVSCMMYAMGKRNLTVSLDWSSHFGAPRTSAAMVESFKFPPKVPPKGFKCEASIDSDFWRHDPRTWESILPIVTNGIRRMKRERGVARIGQHFKLTDLMFPNGQLLGDE